MTAWRAAKLPRPNDSIQGSVSAGNWRGVARELVLSWRSCGAAEYVPTQQVVLTCHERLRK